MSVLPEDRMGPEHARSDVYPPLACSVTHPALSARNPWGWHQGSPRPLSGWACSPFLPASFQFLASAHLRFLGASKKEGWVQASVNVEFQTKSFNCPL